MQIRRFRTERDLEHLEAFLRKQYFQNHNTVSWLPARLHDLLYRVGAHETDEGRVTSAAYIFLWEENEELVACILPDGENVYMSIQRGFERLFPSMVAFAEQNCLPLFAKAEDGTVKFWLAISDSLTDAQKTLADSGYRKYPEEEYASCVCPSEADGTIRLPDGFRFLYGEACPDEENKWSALRLGFHPDWEAADYRAGMNPYVGRKRSSLYPDSFECVVIDENAGEKNNVCAYCFVYLDRQTRTALIEPLSTREQYRHRGFGTALLHGAVHRCQKQGIEKCYVNSFGWRKDFYSAAGFCVENRIGFWYKRI